MLGLLHENTSVVKVILHHRQIPCSHSGLNQDAKAIPGEQFEGSVYKDSKRLTQLGPKLLLLYQ